LVEEAEKFAAWHVHRKPNAPLRDVAAAFRNWLSRADEEADAPSLAALIAESQTSTAVGTVVSSDRAKQAWGRAKALLEERIVEPSAFPLYIAPLEAVGERNGKLVLVDGSEHGGGGGWFTRKYRPLALEALDGFDDIEIVDETQLEYEAR
jgi:hypothetical protein